MFNPWADTILAELTARGIPYVIDEPYRIVQLGSWREFDGDADVRAWVVLDPHASLPVDAEVLATVPGIPKPDEITEDEWRENPDLWSGWVIRVVAEPFDPSSTGG
jgi:hypothetical protein